MARAYHEFARSRGLVTNAATEAKDDNPIAFALAQGRSTLLARVAHLRYPWPMATPELIPESNILDAFNYRHATKVFDAQKKISESDFNLILEAARLSPSSFGAEPWQILVIQDPAKRALLKPFTWGATGMLSGNEGQLATASHFCVFLGHTSKMVKDDAKPLFEHMTKVKQFPEDILKGFMVHYKKFQEVDFEINGECQGSCRLSVMSDYSMYDLGMASALGSRLVQVDFLMALPLARCSAPAFRMPCSRSLVGLFA